ncbi:G-protein alpha subunit-domain-containing protein [Mycena olivaceomarginata]|nr:G-protein alpha subunit-domain-containing protein [Mycena olivaceomarginata]
MHIPGIEPSIPQEGNSEKHRYRVAIPAVETSSTPSSSSDPARHCPRTTAAPPEELRSNFQAELDPAPEWEALRTRLLRTRLLPLPGSAARRGAAHRAPGLVPPHEDEPTRLDFGGGCRLARSFLKDLERVTVPNYLPMDDDVLRARLKTVGVSEYTFEMEVHPRVSARLQPSLPTSVPHSHLLAYLSSHSSFPPAPLPFAMFLHLPSVSTGCETSTEWRIVDVGGSRSQVSAPFSCFFWRVFLGGGGGDVNWGCDFLGGGAHWGFGIVAWCGRPCTILLLFLPVVRSLSYDYTALTTPPRPSSTVHFTFLTLEQEHHTNVGVAGLKRRGCRFPTMASLFTLHRQFVNPDHVYLVMDLCTGGDMYGAILDGVYHGQTELIKRTFASLVDAGDAWALCIILVNLVTVMNPLYTTQPSDARWRAFTADISSYLCEIIPISRPLNELLSRCFRTNLRRCPALAAARDSLYYSHHC